MKKRSDGQKKKSDNKNKDSMDAKKTTDEKPAAQEQEDSGSKGALQIPGYFWWLGLLAIMLFSIYLRAIVPWNGVFTGNNTVMLSSESDAWYHMMLAKSTAMHLERTFYDPLTNFPNGTSIHFGPFVSWGIAILAYIAALGYPSMHTVDVVGAFWPAIMGTLLVLPAFFIGKELGGKACGFITALLTVVLPGQLISRTTLGFTDHHSSEILLSTLAMLFFILALVNGRYLSFNTILKGDLKSLKYPLLYTVLAGIAMGLYIDAWALGIMFEGILLIAIVTQSIVDHIRGRETEYLGIIPAIALFIAMLMVLPFANRSNGFGLVQYSLFQPTILLLGVIFSLAIAVLSKMLKQKGLSKYYFPGAILGIIILGFLFLNIAAPQFVDPLVSALFSYLFPRTGGAATVAELSPIYANNGIQANFPGIVGLLSPFFLAIVGLALLAYRYIKKQSPADLLVVVWSLFILIITLASNRSAYYFAVNVAILCAFLCAEIIRLADRNNELGFEHVSIGMLLPSILLVVLLVMFGSPSTLLLMLTLIVLPMALMLVVFDVLKKPLKKNAELSLIVVFFFILLIFPSTLLSFAETKYTSGPTSDWYTSSIWLYNNTPYPGMDIYDIYQRPAQGQYPYPDTAYGVMSWWDYGHLMETIGHRIPNANPFQEGIGNATAGIPGSSPYFLAESEEEAEKVLANLDKNRSIYLTTKYVMPDGEMAFGKFYAMTAWSKIPFSRYAAAVYQPQGGQLAPIQLYRQPYFKTMVARLQLFDGSETPIGDAVGIAYNSMQLEDGSSVPVITEAPLFSNNYTELQEYVNKSIAKGNRAEIASRDQVTPSVPLEALKHYRLVHESENDYYVHGLKWVKTFEHVPGAVITGAAPAGTKVSIAVPIMTNSNRAFIYRQSNVSDGRFTLVVPYSTEGPAQNGTKFDTKPMGAYQLQVGDKTYEVKVPEEMVMSGGVIEV
jgi:dolichyl-diphosphooligosaccharide--protein glycosyltransferase